MLNISGKNIELTRGDTGYVDFVPINADKTEYIIGEGDKVYFRAKSETVLEKQCVAEVGSSIATVCFTPADTIDLPFGEYPYEVEIVTANDEHFTFIAGSYFIVTFEVEEHENA